MFSDWAEYQCQGHHESQNRITKREGVQIWTKIAIGVGAGVAVLVAGLAIGAGVALIVRE